MLKTIPFSIALYDLSGKYKQNFVILVRTGMFFFIFRTGSYRYYPIFPIFARHCVCKAMKNNESKYKQVVNFVIDGIAEGKLQKGDWIPSINEFRENYRLSRDTVFAGLSELKSRGIIASTPGVGYYIASARIPSEQNIFLLFNEFNEFKEDLYNSFMEHVGKGVSVDLYFHNYNRRVFDALVTDANGKYTTYIIMPGKFTGIGPLLESLSGRVFLLDHFHPELLGRYSSVAQNFEKDTYEALCHGLRHIRKYERLLMVQHEKKEPQERYDGLVRFCAEHGFGHEYLASIRDREIREGDLFILVSDRDLVTLLKQAERQQMTPGREFGIISYNDTPLKEILAGGITTLSTDFRQMGLTLAQLIFQKGIRNIENPWMLNIRRSL
jgi:putative transcriptional regulator